MPKRPNAHKLASQALHLSDALDAALQGKYEVGLIEATLGHSAFRIALSRSATRVVSITSAVLRGGKTSSAYAQRGNYLIVQDQEVVGVVNTPKAYKALLKAGRIPKTASEDSSKLDEFFNIDRSADKQEIDIWAKKDEERIAEAAYLESRIRRRRAGAAERISPLIRLDDDSVEDSDPAEDLEASAEAVEVCAEAGAEASEEEPAAEGRRVITSARRLRAIALKEAAEKAALEAEVAAATAATRAAAEAIRARYEAEQEEERRLQALSRPKTKGWEEMSDDEIDIDAI